MHPGRIEEVKALSDDKIVNSHLKKGWMLLDARVIQLSPESSGQKAMGYYIVGRKGKSPLEESKELDMIRKHMHPGRMEEMRLCGKKMASDELKKTKNQDE